MVILSVSIIGSAVADPLKNSLQRLENIQTDGLRIQVSAQISSHMPYSTERLVPLNELLKYISIEADIDAQSSALSLKAEDVTLLTWIRNEENGTVYDWTDADPEHIYIGEEGSDFLFLFGNTLESENKDPDFPYTGKEYGILQDTEDCILRLTELFPESVKTEKIRTKIGEFGTATEKITYTIPKSFIDDGTYSASVLSVCNDGLLKEWIGKVSFIGKQTVILYKNEQGELIRFVYAGNIRYEDGKNHSLNLNWKTGVTEGQRKDSIILKSPAVSGNDRDNLTLERCLTENADDDHVKISWSYTRVRGKEKTVVDGEADLIETDEETTGVCGTFRTESRVNNGVKKGWFLKPDLKIATDSVNGTVEVSEIRDGNMPESAVLTVSIGKADSTGTVPDRSLEEIDLRTTGDLGEQNAGKLTEKVAAHLIKSVMKLPEEALRLLSTGLSDIQWQQVKNAAQ